jgi:hypothetical protein
MIKPKFFRRLKQRFGACGQYYKPMMIVNDDSRVVNKLEASLTDDARVVIYDCHMFIVQATSDGVLCHLVNLPFYQPLKRGHNLNANKIHTPYSIPFLLYSFSWEKCYLLFYGYN